MSAGRMPCQHERPGSSGGENFVPSFSNVLIEHLVASDRFKDAFDIYAGFVENAAAEYAAESSKVAGIGSRIASETAKRVREEAQASIDDMAAQTVSA